MYTLSVKRDNNPTNTHRMNGVKVGDRVLLQYGAMCGEDEGTVYGFYTTDFGSEVIVKLDEDGESGGGFAMVSKLQKEGERGIGSRLIK